MKKNIFYIVDVFAEKKYAGNQLAVFRNAKDLSGSTMQKIAREMHFSETTFIKSDKKKNNGYDVRIFTPEEELPFAGHPTLGTAFIIQQTLLKRPAEKINLNLKVGQIPVTFKYTDKSPGILWMKQITPVFGKKFRLKQTAEALGLTASQIDGRFPVEEVSTGIPFIIVPLKALSAVKMIDIDRKKYLALIKGAKSKCMLAFCPETYDRLNDLNVRAFAPIYGVPEDPATGSANGCLAGYLVRHRYFGQDKIDIRVEQGHEINRPSLLYLKAHKAGGRIEIFVGGRVRLVATGEFI